MRTIPWKQLLISIGVVAVIVWRVPFASLRAPFHRLVPGYLSLALICSLFLLFLRAYKWQQLMAAAGRPYVRQAVRTLLAGLAMGLLTPARLGELGRCVFVRAEERVEVALLTVFERLLDTWALLTLVCASLFLLTSHPAAVFGLAVWFATIPVVMGFPALVFHLANWARRSRFHSRFWDATVRMPQVSTPRFAVLALLAIGVELASFFFFLCAFSRTGFASVLATYPYIVLAGDLPISFSGMGVREGAAAMLLSPYAVPSGAAVDAALMWFIFVILMPGVLGAAWLLAERLNTGARKSAILTLPAGPSSVPILPPEAANSFAAESSAPRLKAS